MPISLPEAELVGTFLEALGFGIYMVIFSDCVKVLRERHLQRKPIGYLVVTTVLIFLLVITHLITDLVRVVEAFIRNNGIANGAFKYYGNINTYKNILKSSSYVAATLVSDAFIVYRTYIVWGKKPLIIVIPILLLLADAATSIWATWSISQVLPGENVLVANVTRRVKYFFSFTLALNLLCTLLISFKIWNIQRNVSGYSLNTNKSRLSGVMAIIIESAAAYSVLLIVLIVTSVVGTAGMFIVLNSVSPVIGIAFASIIARVGMGVSHGETSGRPYNTGISTTNGRTTHPSNPFSKRDYPEGVQISLQKVVHSDAEPESPVMKMREMEGPNHRV